MLVIPRCYAQAGAACAVEIGFSEIERLADTQPV
jgi:hypothetical protein